MYFGEDASCQDIQYIYTNSCLRRSCYDDIAFIRGIVDYVGDNYCLDADSVHMTGSSNGGMLTWSSLNRPGLPDGYSQVFRSYVFGPSGFWTIAPLCYAAKFDPFLSLRPHALHPGAIQGKEGIKFCHLATMCEMGRDFA